MPASHMPQELSLAAKATTSKLVTYIMRRDSKSRIECSKRSKCEPAKDTDTDAVEMFDVHVFFKFESIRYKQFSLHCSIFFMLEIMQILSAFLIFNVFMLGSIQI